MHVSDDGSGHFGGEGLRREEDWRDGAVSGVGLRVKVHVGLGVPQHWVGLLENMYGLSEVGHLRGKETIKSRVVHVLPRCWVAALLRHAGKHCRNMGRSIGVSAYAHVLYCIYQSMAKSIEHTLPTTQTRFLPCNGSDSPGYPFQTQIACHDHTSTNSTHERKERA